MVLAEICDVPDSISLRDGSTPIPILSVDTMFRQTVYGETLLNRSRWGDFKPEYLSDESFQAIAGVDTNNGKHLLLSYGITRQFLLHCRTPHRIWGKPVGDIARFTPAEEEILVLASDDHDWGEAEVGDTAQPNKTKKSEQKEFKALLRIANEVTVGHHKTFGTIFRRVDPYLTWLSSPVYHAVWRGAYRVVRGDNELFGKVFESVDTVLIQSNSKVARAFNAIEKIGYMRTGLRGWKKAPEYEGYEDLSARLCGMAFSVHTHNMADLIRYADDYPPVLEFLAANAAIISEVYNTDPTAAAITLHTYQSKKDIRELTRKFKAQKEAWDAWRESVRVNADVMSKDIANL